MVAMTPGPWFAHLNTRETAFIIENEAMREDTHALICSISWWTSGGELCPTKEISESNARLIAAAPDMFALLREIVAPYSEMCDDSLEEFSKNHPHHAVREKAKIAFRARKIIRRIEAERRC